MTSVEPTMIGVSEETHIKLKRLKEDGHFNEMADAYRFGIGLALAMSVVPPDLTSHTTVFSVATIDPDQLIKTSIQAVMGSHLGDGSVYRMAERLADWGIQELYAESERGNLEIGRLLNQLEQGSLAK